MEGIHSSGQTQGSIVKEITPNTCFYGHTDFHVVYHIRNSGDLTFLIMFLMVLK